MRSVKTSHLHTCYKKESPSVPPIHLETTKMYCNFSSDCSNMFDGVDISWTSIHAVLAATIAVISILVNLLLIVGLTANLDKFIPFIISILVANIIVTVFLNGEILATSISRRWIFGYHGCHLISFIITCGFFARWLSGLFSLVRVTQCPCLSGYRRYEKRAVAFFIAKSWVLAIICASATTYILKHQNNIFAVTIPGCFNSIYFPSIFNLCAIVWIGCVLFAFCFPLFLLCNNRFMKTPQMQSRVHPAMPERSRARQAQERTCRCRMVNNDKVALIYYWLATVPQFFVAVLYLQHFILEDSLHLLQAKVPAGFAIMVIFESYPLTDIVIILLNKQLRQCFLKLPSTIYALWSPHTRNRETSSPTYTESQL